MLPHFELNAVALLLLQMATVLLVARLLSYVTHWLRQPRVIAEVLAGVVLGPSLLGRCWPAAMQALFPPSSLEPLRLLSSVGLVIFMFLIGVEFDPKMLAGRTRASLLISHFGIALPFALGAGAAHWLYDSYSPPGHSFLGFALFLGSALSVTAFPVLARVLRERGLLRSQIGTVALTCAAVADLIAWCLLALVVSVTRAQGLAQALWTSALAATLVCVTFLLVRPLAAYAIARSSGEAEPSSSFVVFTLLSLLLSSSLAELIGVHALLGAFLFGFALPKARGVTSLVNRLEVPGSVLLLPVFFAYSGLRTHLGLLSTPREWLVTLLLIVLATLGKFGGSALAARISGSSWREASGIGVLMNTRGLMELVVLNIGMDLGVISPTLFAMLIVMALTTTFATTPVLGAIYPPGTLESSLPYRRGARTRNQRQHAVQPETSN